MLLICASKRVWAALSSTSLCVCCTLNLSIPLMHLCCFVRWSPQRMLQSKMKAATFQWLMLWSFQTLAKVVKIGLNASSCSVREVCQLNFRIPPQPTAKHYSPLNIKRLSDFSVRIITAQRWWGPNRPIDLARSNFLRVPNRIIYKEVHRMGSKGPRKLLFF